MNHPQHPFKGVMLAASALLLFAGMDSCTKYLTAHYQVPVVVAMRYLVHLALMLVILAPRHSQALVKIQENKELTTASRWGKVMITRRRRRDDFKRN